MRRLAVAVACLVGMVFAAAALTATGDLTPTGCIASGGVSGCNDIGNGTLDTAAGVGVSPDDKTVYVLGGSISQTGAVNVFTRATNGDLTPAGCITSASGADVTGCDNLGNGSLAYAEQLAISKDGANVYVTGVYNGTINVFTRDGSGALTLAACIASATVSGCSDIGNDSLAGAAGIVVSPDGKNVYVAAGEPGSGTINVFSRATANGALTPSGCYASGRSLAGCTALSNNSLNGATKLAISPDGATLYVTSSLASAINVFTRSPATGALTPAGCISSGNLAGCNDIGNNSLAPANGVTVSPDGKNVYAVGSNAINVFIRSKTTGAITPAGCIASGTVTGCNDIGNSSLDNATDVVVSPDGQDVYVTGGYPANTINVFARAPATGALTPDGCIASGTVSGCDSLPNNGLDGARDIALSADGSSLYVTGYLGHTLTVFHRATATGRGSGNGGSGSGSNGSGSGSSGSSGNGGSGSAGSSSSGSGSSGRPRFTRALRTKNTRFHVRGVKPSPSAQHTPAGTIFSFSLSEDAHVTITIFRIKPGRLVSGKCVPPTRTNTIHSHCTRLVRVSGSIGAKAHAGEDSVSFSGAIGGTVLSTGSYRASALARDTSGRTSAMSITRFSIAS